MDLLSHIKRELVKKAYRYGLVLTPEALDYLLFSVKDVDEVLRSLSKRGVATVRLEDLIHPEPRKEEQVREETVAEKKLEEPKECDNRIRIRLYVDPGEIYPSSWEREREKILLDRLEEISSLLLSKGHISFSDYDRAKRSEEQRYILALLLKIDSTPGGKTLLYVENQEEATTVLYPPSKGLERKVKYLDSDAVVALGVRGKEGTLFLTDVVYPGLAGYSPSRDACTYRLLVVPNPFERNLPSLPLESVDGVLLISNIVNVYKTPNPKKEYRNLDTFLSSIEKDVFVVPGPFDAVRSVPPHPPLDEELLPDSSSLDNVHLLGSPAVVKVNRTTLLLYDGYYYSSTGRPVEEIVMTRLVQPNISSFPYLSSRDYSLLRRLPDVVISPAGGSARSVGDVGIFPQNIPYILELSSRKVVGLEA